jgi:glutamate carboxypeptidase
MGTADLRGQARLLLPAMVDAIEALVVVESPSEDVAACIAVVHEAIGAFSAWLPTPARVETHGGRPVWRWGPDQPSILLLGHLDTVWPMGTIERLPFRTDGGLLRGPGVFDMKAGVVQGWAALALAQCTEESGVGMLLTTDEEIGSPSTRALLRDSARHARAVLVLEPSIDGHLKTARKGTSWYVVDVHGRATHAGLEPERGVNALVATADFVMQSSSWGDAERATTVTPTMLTAGTTANTVPARARVTLDVRAWTAAEQHRIDDAVRAWRPGHPQATVHVSGGIDRPAMEETASAALFARAQQVGARLGLEPIDGRAVGGASDGNITAAAGVPTLDGLGAVGEGAHADHESIRIADLADRAALLAALLLDLLEHPTP